MLLNHCSKKVLTSATHTTFSEHLLLPASIRAGAPGSWDDTRADAHGYKNVYFSGRTTNCLHLLPYFQVPKRKISLQLPKFPSKSPPNFFHTGKRGEGETYWRQFGHILDAYFSCLKATLHGGLYSPTPFPSLNRSVYHIWSHQNTWINTISGILSGCKPGDFMYPAISQLL